MHALDLTKAERLATGAGDFFDADAEARALGQRGERHRPALQQPGDALRGVGIQGFFERDIKR